MITNLFAWYQRFIAINTTSYAWCVFKEKEFSNLHQVCNCVQTGNIIPQDFLILVIRKKSSWGLGRRWKGRGQWVGGDIIAPPRHPPISTHPPPCVPKSQSYLVPEFLRTHLFNSALWWTHQIVFSDFYKILVKSLHNFFLIFFREYLFEYSLQTGCADVIYDCPIFCRKFRDIWRCKVVWVGVDIISVELPLPTFLQSQDPEDQYHRRHHHHSRHCHHKSHHLEHCHNFVSYILLWQKIRRPICQIFCTSMLSNNSKFTW